MKKLITIVAAIVVSTSLSSQVNTFASNTHNTSDSYHQNHNNSSNNQSSADFDQVKNIITSSANPPIDAKTKTGNVKVKGTKGGSWNYTYRTNSGAIIEEHKNLGSEDSLLNLGAGTYIVEISENTNNGNLGEVITQTITINESRTAAQADLVNAGTTVTPNTNINNIKFTVFPNPNNGEFSVDITGLENNHEITLTLKNDQGNTVYNSYFFTQDESSIQRKIVPETKLENGIYYCTMSVQGIEHTVKVLVR